MIELNVVQSPDAPRVEWLKARRGGIGGSDIAAILGRPAYRTALQVWLDKTATDEPVDDPTPAQEWGHRLEPALRAKFADEHPDLTVTGSPGLVQHPEHPWALVTPDGTTYGDLTPGLLELKTVGGHAEREWDDDDAPEQYLLQTHWSMAVTGVRRVHLFALLLGSRRHVDLVIERDDALCDLLLKRAGEWWQTHVVEGVMPEPNPDRDGEVLGALWNGREHSRADLDDLADVVSDLRSVRASIDHLTGQRRELEAVLKVALGDRTDGYIGDVPAVTWRRAKDGTAFDLERFRAEHPDLHAAYITPTTGSRRFLVKEAKA